jgi:hypothetical protein
MTAGFVLVMGAVRVLSGRGCAMRCFTGLLALFCCALAGGPAEAERRLALAVGIDVYDNLPADQQLQKAVNDARAMGKALGRLGFETVVEENVARLPFTRAWQKFLNRLEPGDTAALFFAGHGVEIGGLNYLLPRDVPKVVAGEDRVLAEAAIRFNTLMDDLRDKKVRVALFIVDACRDNPFRDGAGRSVGGTRGLARLEPAEGAFVMYSAGAGEEALDRLQGADRSPNSVYTRAAADPRDAGAVAAGHRHQGAAAGGGGGARRGAPADAGLLRPDRRRLRAEGGAGGGPQGARWLATAERGCAGVGGRPGTAPMLPCWRRSAGSTGLPTRSTTG